MPGGRRPTQHRQAGLSSLEVEPKREDSYIWKEHAVERPGGYRAHHAGFAGAVQAPVLVGQLPSVCKAAATALLERLGDGAEQQRIARGPAPRPGLGVSGFLPQASPAPWEAGGPHRSQSRSPRSPRHSAHTGHGLVAVAGKVLQQSHIYSKDGTREGQGLLAAGWPCPARLF